MTRSTHAEESLRARLSPVVIEETPTTAPTRTVETVVQHAAALQAALVEEVSRPRPAKTEIPVERAEAEEAPTTDPIVPDAAHAQAPAPSQEASEEPTDYFEPSEITVGDNPEEAEQPVVLEQFAEALFSITDGAENDIERPALDYSEIEEAESASPVPPIVAEVAEGLMQLEPAEKLAVAPIIQDISATLQLIRSLQTEAAPAAQLKAAEEKLLELTLRLFESLGREYDEEKALQFVQALLRPEFMEHLTNGQQMFAEGVGTHEVKRSLSQFFNAVADEFAELTTHQLLGTLAISSGMR